MLPTKLFVALTIIVVGISTCYAGNIAKLSTGSHGSTSVYSMHSQRGWLGVEVQDVTKSLKDRKKLTVDVGAYVQNVVEDSPADKAGIQDGDVIVKLDGQTIDDSDDLLRVMRHSKPKSEIKVELLHEGATKSLAVTLGKEPRVNAFSFNFRTPTAPRMPTFPRMPRLPRMPRHWFFSSDDMYGLSVESLTKQLAEYLEVPSGKGVLVNEVEKGSGADKAGFKAGDVITKIGDSAVRDIEDLREELSDRQDGDKKFDVIRKGKSLSLSLHLDASRNDDEDNDDDDDLSGAVIPDQQAPCPAAVQTDTQQQASVVHPLIDFEYLRSVVVSEVLRFIHTIAEKLQLS